jgi:diadenylate cyclase
MPQLPPPLQTFFDTLRDYHRPTDVVDILLIALVIFCALVWLKGTTGMSLVRGAAIVIVVAVALGSLLHLRVVSWILQNSIPALLVGIPIIFQPEIRRGLERLGRTRVGTRRHQRASDQVLTEIVDASQEMSRSRTGALIVVERGTGLDDYMRSGTIMDATPSRELVLTVFWRNNALHDGAMVVRDNRIAAAGCTLPLSEAQIASHYGTRHRAALGLSERTDAVVIVVSEETGAVTIAVNGVFESHLDRTRLRERLASLLQREESTPSRVADSAARVIYRNGRIFRRAPDGKYEPAQVETLDTDGATRDSFAAEIDADELAEATRRAGGGRT